MKRFLLISFIASGYLMNAQSIGNSPYAVFGIGDVKFDNSIDHNAMGGISTAYINDFNNSFNFKNPAANANLDLTSFKLEGTNENNFYKSDYNNINLTKHSTYLSNISIALPLTRKVKFGLGFQPYSSKAYDITTKNVSSDGTIYQSNHFFGKGTLSTVQAALSYNISPNFALGLRTNFYFGKIYDTEEIALNNSELLNGFETYNKVKAFNFTLGTTYQKKFENDHKFTAGATYTFGTKGTMDMHYSNSTYYYTANNKTNESIISENFSKNKNLIPTSASLGIAYGHEGKWFASTQVDYKKAEEIYYMSKPFQLGNSYKIALGAWYLPNYNNFRNYFSRIIYRAGAYYEKGDLNLQINANNPTNINKFALTAGMTLPFANANINRMNSIELAVEVGKRGTLQNNMISQSFVNVKLGLTFADKWFQKRQYD